jgi:hypothetical protein
LYYATKPGQAHSRKPRVANKVLKEKKDEMGDRIGGLKKREKSQDGAGQIMSELQPTKLHLILSILTTGIV